jgi:hypothetical protein
MVKRLRSRWFQLFKAFQPFKSINTGIRHEARGNRQKLIVPDVPHHVQRGRAGWMDIFLSAEDRQEYLDTGQFRGTAIPVSGRSRQEGQACVLGNFIFDPSGTHSFITRKQ